MPLYALLVACSSATPTPPPAQAAPPPAPVAQAAPVEVDDGREAFEPAMENGPGGRRGRMGEMGAPGGGPGGMRGRDAQAGGRPGGPPGGPPGGGGGGGMGPGGAGGGVAAVSFTYNNGRGLARTADGTAHVVYADHGTPVYRRGPLDALTAAPSPMGSSIGSVAIDTDGKKALGLTWSAGRPGAVWGSISTDAGKSWSTPAMLSPGGANGTQPNLRVWTSDGVTRAVAVWHAGNRGGPTTVWSAGFDGKSWLPAVAVSTGTAESSFPSIAGSGEDTIVIWRDTRNGGGKELYTARRSGVTGAWRDERALGIRGADPSVCVSSDGVVHLAYQAMQVVSYARSTDGGASFGAPVALDRSALFGRVLCGAGAKVAVIWEDLATGATMRDDDQKTVGFATSTDGRTFTPVSLTGGVMSQVFPTAAMNPDGSVDLAWIDKPSASPRTQTWKAW